MDTKLGKILAEISAGELIDKITILEIKKLKISNKEKLIEIDKELISLSVTMNKFIPQMEPWFGIEETNALTEYMSGGGWVTEFKQTEQFEKLIAEYEPFELL